MHATAAGRPRAERVAQSRRRDPSVLDFGSYVPAESAVEKTAAWQRSGAEVCYLSSHRVQADVETDLGVLAAHGFPPGTVFFREPGESYTDVARRARADVVVEDDCESIGGRGEMATPSLGLDRGSAISSVVVPEFGGLAHLPDDPIDLIQK